MHNQRHMPRYPTYYQPTPAQPTIAQPTYQQPIETPDMTEAQFIQQFLNPDGQLDIGKVLKTVNQLADTIQQVAPVVKQINELVRTWKQ